MKSGLDGSHGVGSQGKVATPSPMRPLPEYVLRLAAVVVTLVATIVMGVAKQTKTISIDIAPTLPPLAITATAKARSSSALIYFVVANSIACVYSALALAISIAKKSSSRRNLALLISISDVLVLALLFSSNGAALAIGVVGRNGNSHVGWNKICNVYEKFCVNGAASMFISQLGSLFYLMLVLLTVVGLHRSSRSG